MLRMDMDQEKFTEFQIWADDVTRGILEELTDEEFSMDVLPPFGSIRSLATHIVLAIEYNLERRVRKKEVDPQEMGEEIYNLSKEELLARWRVADEGLLKFARNENNEEYIFPNFLGEGEIRVSHGDYTMQYLFHTVHHRAQIMSALRAMGKAGKTTDYLFYLSHLSRQ